MFGRRFWVHVGGQRGIDTIRSLPPSKLYKLNLSKNNNRMRRLLERLSRCYSISRKIRRGLQMRIWEGMMRSCSSVPRGTTVSSSNHLHSLSPSSPYVRLITDAVDHKSLIHSPQSHPSSIIPHLPPKRRQLHRDPFFVGLSDDRGMVCGYLGGEVRLSSGFTGSCEFGLRSTSMD